ncbi:molybdopterin cofactor-binding domain-containing protein [Rhizobium tubonense]|uniref:Aldehyde dehydrogenase n=1 Tax=Rhizobium tubonense TaxID=484088 RepID=A0A2W4CP04_9HYPH|nr:molybdopterin cofactor-binding domain-containing protein [Rhizobium tubonense]PZM14517.1 aldehyde dehydrogenase [Rhizobium tubonense]
MTTTQDIPRSQYLSSKEILLVVRSRGGGDPDIFLAVFPDGTATALNGHVDLGTGIRTSLAQIVAEELDVGFDQVRVVLGTTTIAPDQGATIASETIQVSAVPLRQAAATARRYLLEQAARLHAIDPALLTIEDGVIRPQSPANWSIGMGELIAGRHVRIEIDPSVTVKTVDTYRIVGKPQPRNDIAAKATGTWNYVHDVRLAEMLHGRVVRPPYIGFDSGDHVGHSLISIDERSIEGIDGIVALVAIGDFIGIVATREENAAAAAERLKVMWRDPPLLADLNNPEQAIRDNPATARVLADQGNVELALEGAAPRFDRSYVWPFQMHASIGPSCAVADWSAERLVVWSGTQNPFSMRRDLALLMDMPEDAVTVERLEAAGCYGRNCADDVTADAALLSRAVGRPVRVQLTREQENGWEPKGAGQVVDVRGGLDLEGGPAAYDFESSYPSNLAPTLALILTGKVSNKGAALDMGDRTAIPPYAFSNMRITVHDMPPIARASWFRGVSALPNSFAHESYIDELAFAAGVDPVEYRLRYLKDPRAVDLVRAVTERAGWAPRTTTGTMGSEGDLLYGRGFAYALYVHGKFPGTPAAWSAWVADVAVNRRTGEITVTRVTVGQDSGLMINPDGVRHQIHGNVIQSTSRVLKEQVSFTDIAVESSEWGSYPILTFQELPEIDVLMMPRQNEEPRGAGESASVPSAAAIVNAVFDATGIRFRELPLTPERVLAALGERRIQPTLPAAKPERPSVWRRGSVLAGIGGICASIVAGGILTASPWRGAYPEITRPTFDTFSPATIEKGRLAAAAGACNVCHTGEDGTPFAGGRPFETPFGTVYATNISSDEASGIGAWSYPAFERAMRNGVSRDGHHLYPVHPYPSFSGAHDADLQALYAFLMAQAPVAKPAPPSRLRFPFNFRSLMSVWNSLFAGANPLKPNAEKSTAWNRGAYLVETLGHCSACHSPRNALGAEIGGLSHFAGGFADGWHAPALNGSSMTPVGWSEDALFSYLRRGAVDGHGGAGGPMAAVVKSMAALPDDDIRAMATYLADLNPTSEADAARQRSAALASSDAARETAARIAPRGARMFKAACTACHETQSTISQLALNSAIHATRPDNVLQAILQGANAPALLSKENAEVMSMPSYAASYNDKQLADLAAYLRARFAPDKPAWEDLARAAAAARDISHPEWAGP